MDYTKSLEETRKQVSHFNSLISNKHHYLQDVNKTITLRNVQGPLPAKAWVRPQEHHLTHELLGVEKLSPEQAKDRPFHPTKKTKIQLYDSISFNLNDATQRINWNWIQYSLLIVETLAEARMSPMAMFYIQDDERETQDRVTKADTSYNAEKLVREWSVSERMNNARLLGQDMSNHTPEEVLIYLVDKARLSPAEAQTILDLVKDQYRKERLLLLRLKDAGIVEEKNGSLYYQSIRLGVDERSAMAYMLQTDNRDIVDQMKAVFENMRKPNLSGHVDVPVRGVSLPASSTGVNPPMLPPLPPVAPNQLTLDQLVVLAPLGYEKLVASLSPPLVDYLRQHPDQVMFEKIVKDEMAFALAKANQAAAYSERLVTAPAPLPVAPPAQQVDAIEAIKAPAAFELEDELEEFDNPERAQQVLAGKKTQADRIEAVLRAEGANTSTLLDMIETDLHHESELPKATTPGVDTNPADVLPPATAPRESQPSLSAAKQRKAEADAKKKEQDTANGTTPTT